MSLSSIFWTTLIDSSELTFPLSEYCEPSTDSYLQETLWKITPQDSTFLYKCRRMGYLFLL